MHRLQEEHWHPYRQQEGHLSYAQVMGEHPASAQARGGTPGILTGLSNEKLCEGGQMHVLC